VAKYWAKGLVVQSVSNINFYNLLIAGVGATGSIGVSLSGASSANGVVYNFTGSVFNNLDVGISHGTYIQGVTVSQSNFTAGNFGLQLISSTGVDQVVVTGSQFNVAKEGIHSNGGVQFIISGNLFLLTVNNAYGIHIIAQQGALISNNYFVQGNAATGIFGIVIEAETYPSMVSNNQFWTNVPGIWLPTASTAYSTIFSGNNYAATPFSLTGGDTVLQDSPQVAATLLAASSTFKGRQAFVTDSTTATWGATVTGGGANNVLVVCDGTNWTVMGK
jgi:hypothetical protein